MTRETKIGLAMVLLMVGVFGFLVYKRVTRPGESAADVEQSADNRDDPSSGVLTLTDADDEFATPQAPEILPVAAQARPIQVEDPEEVDDPFGAPEIVRQAAPSRPNLPTSIPDDANSDDDANDPFLSESTATERDESTTMVIGEPEDVTADPFSSEGDSEELAANDSGSGPALGFEAADDQQLEPEQPVRRSRPTEPLTIRVEPTHTEPTSPSFGGVREAEDDGETISIRARASLPEREFAEEEAEEETVSIQPIPVAERSETPQLMLDDSDEDRFGGYRPVEIVELEERTLAVAEAPRKTSPARDGGRIDPFANQSGAHSGRSHVVKPNETFWSISQKYYGTGRYFQALAAYNHRQIPDPTKMKPGVTIALPGEDELERRYASLLPKTSTHEPGAADGQANQSGELLMGQDGRTMYRIGAKDTLSGIAQAYLGRASRWVQILEMNRDTLKDGNSLKIGMVLRLPHDARPSQVTEQPAFFR